MAFSYVTLKRYELKSLLFIALDLTPISFACMRIERQRKLYEVCEYGQFSEFLIRFWP